MPVTVEDVRELVGEIDDVAMAEIEATGASREEIAEAQAWFDGDDEVARNLGEPSSPRVERVLQILDDALGEDAEDEEGIYGPV